MPLAPFLVGDAALIGTAVLIGKYCAAPIGPWPLLAIALCVIAGAVLSALPFVVNYAKRQDAELTERQNQIAALARTTAESAEQLSIAAASLHGIAEASSGNLKLIEQFPAQLQEHLKGLQKQLAVSPAKAAATTDESPRIEGAAARIAQAVAELAKLETATRQHLASAHATLFQVSAQTEKAGAQAGQQLAELATTAFLAAKNQALADFELQLTAAATRALAALEPAATETPRRKRPKPASEEIPATEETLSAETTAPSPAPAPPGIESITPPAPVETPAPDQPPVESTPPESALTEETLSTPANPSPEEVPVAEAPKPRVRQPKPPADSGLDLGLSVDAPEPEIAISSDGFTRLIATAYIGIGNKLFIRGEGPGLSWDKGVPLQFVSIGKWRWETADATAPIHAKLYKNDQTECTSVGTLTLEPGHQHDVNAGF